MKDVGFYEISYFPVRPGKVKQKKKKKNLKNAKNENLMYFLSGDVIMTHDDVNTEKFPLCTERIENKRNQHSEKFGVFLH